MRNMLSDQIGWWLRYVYFYWVK